MELKFTLLKGLKLQVFYADKDVIETLLMFTF